MQYGAAQVEAFLDAVLAIQEHVDPSLIKPERQGGFHFGSRGETGKETETPRK